MKDILTSSFDEALLYQKIGEFVVSFQWTEHLIRQIGWFCIDPDMRDHLNDELRTESNNELLNKVAMLHDDFIERHKIDATKGFRLKFNEAIQSFHQYRRFRNNLLHSAYMELKAGGEYELWYVPIQK
ncbi:MAG TPA: hypothetical protein VHS53_17680 [Mucilaginibacter sp.]|jgi:hypothetical protein|nr:hypothetical protein [Mucilaginibacter sp.]